MASIRLQKFLSSAGVCSRRKGEALILEGVVKVNGRLVTQLGTKIDPETDKVEVNGIEVVQESLSIYILLNKPKGFVTSCKQPDDRIVLDLIDIPDRIFPVGRLDKDSTGLLILTNDGRIHHRLSHPSFDHEKEYEVTVEFPMSQKAIRTMEKGMPLSGSKTRPAEITPLSKRRFRMILKEGKNRQIRRMVKKVGNRVASLKRIRIASLKLGQLKTGQWRYFRDKEKKDLLQMLGL